MKVLLVETKDDRPTMVTGEYRDPEPGPGQLLVEIRATALNRADLLQKSGKYPSPEGASPILGLEMAGVVTETGSGVERFQKGDRVCSLLSGGGYAQFCTVSESIAMPVPAGFTFQQAAAVPEAFLTAWQALAWLGEIRRGEMVLIHGGASGVGSAAIQLATTMFDSRTVTTASSDEKREFCRQLGASLAVDYRNEGFRQPIEASFGEECVDVVVDIAGASHWNQNLALMAKDGRLVLLSLLGGATVDSMKLVPLLRKRLTIRGSTLRNRPEAYKTKLSREFQSACSDALRTGRLKPVIDSVYDWKDVERAHQRMRDNLNLGKIILTGMNPD